MIDSYLPSRHLHGQSLISLRSPMALLLLVLMIPWGTECALSQETDRHAQGATQRSSALQWRELSVLPDPLGLAGPVVGVHNRTLAVGGGANFALPVWEHEKQWHSQLFGLDLDDNNKAWRTLGALPRARAYSACASTPYGIAILGGNDALAVSRECWLLSIEAADRKHIPAKAQHATTVLNESGFDLTRLPDLPQPLVYAQAAWLSGYLVVCCGQTGSKLATATAACWKLRLWSKANDQAVNVSDEATQPSASDEPSGFAGKWERLPDCPGGARSYAMVTATSDATSHALLLIGGRREEDGATKFLNDVWTLDVRNESWSQCAALPVPLAAGTAGPIDRSTIAVLSGDEGENFSRTDELRDKHPGFPLRTWLYDVQRDQWRSGGVPPANQVTTTAIALPGRLILASGEIRPRVRTPRVWEIKLAPNKVK